MQLKAYIIVIYSSIICSVILRSLDLVSNSQNTICCQVPSIKFLSLKGTVKLGPTKGYSRIVLDSSKALHAARALYLKNGFVDIPRYNDDYRADVFMERRLLSY